MSNASSMPGFGHLHGAASLRVAHARQEAGGRERGDGPGFDGAIPVRTSEECEARPAEPVAAAALAPAAFIHLADAAMDWPQEPARTERPLVAQPGPGDAAEAVPAKPAASPHQVTLLLHETHLPPTSTMVVPEAGHAEAAPMARPSARTEAAPSSPLQVLKIRLDSGGGDSVDATLRLRQGALDVRIEAGSEDEAQALRQALGSLSDDLAARGYEVGRIVVQRTRHDDQGLDRQQASGERKRAGGDPDREGFV